MAYPYIHLKLENNTPHIHLFPEEGMSRKLTNTDEDLASIINRMADHFEVDEEKHEEERLVRILDAADEGDELYWENYPPVDDDTFEFQIEDIVINDLLTQAAQFKPEYEDVEGITEEVRAELKKNQNKDIMASLLDTIYQIIIAKLIIAAETSQVNEIHLDTDHNFTRLLNKLNFELGSKGYTVVLK